MSESRIRQRTDSVADSGGIPGSYQVPEVYEPEKIGSGELVDVLIQLGDNAEIRVGDETTSGFSLRREAWKGWYEGEEVFSLTNQGLSLTGDINATSGTFSGMISIGSGDSIFTATEQGIALGSDIWEQAPFRVTAKGFLYAIGATLETSLEGNKVLINSEGITVLNLSEDGESIQSIRLGTSSDDFFSITNSSGTSVASISSVGGSAFSSLSSTDWPVVGAGDWTGIGGSLDEILDRRPRGASYAKLTVAGPGTTTATGWREFSMTLHPGRTYRLSGVVWMKSTVAADVAQVQVRYTSAAVGATPTQPVLASTALLLVSTEVSTITRRVGLDTVFSLADLALTVPSALRFLVCYSRVSGTGTVSADVSTNEPGLVVVEDVGLAPRIVDTAVNDGGGVAVTAPPTLRTLTVAASWTNSYVGDGAYYATPNAWQGNTLQAGMRKSMIGFPDLTQLVGATIQSVTLRLHAKHWRNTTGGTAVVGFHTYLGGPTGPMTGLPSYTADVNRSGVWTGLGTGFVDLSANARQEWATGAKRGVYLGLAQGVVDAAFQISGYFAGANDPDPGLRPQLTITYVI